MSEHDPLCRTSDKDREWRAPKDCFWCDQIAKVRADERERIAQAIEAAAGPARPTLAATAYDHGHQDGHRAGLAYAARIARNGGRDE